VGCQKESTNALVSSGTCTGVTERKGAVPIRKILPRCGICMSARNGGMKSITRRIKQENNQNESLETARQLFKEPWRRDKEKSLRKSISSLPRS